MVEILKDYAWIIQVITLGFVIGVKFTDIKNLAQQVRGLDLKIDEVREDTKTQGERISKVEGYLWRQNANAAT